MVGCERGYGVGTITLCLDTGVNERQNICEGTCVRGRWWCRYVGTKAQLSEECALLGISAQAIILSSAPHAMLSVPLWLHWSWTCRESTMMAIVWVDIWLRAMVVLFW